VGERGTSDRLDDAVDYVEVARLVREISDARQYALLEALATAVADELERRFAPGRLRVRVRKPEVRPAGLEGTVAATVTRP
jgi:dihydroneopterin aldolase